MSTDLQPLRHAFAWARANGWETGWTGPQWQSADRLTGFDWSPDSGEEDVHLIQVVRRQSNRQPWPLSTMWHGVVSVQQAIDLLVYLEVLPAEFSSAYEAGRLAGYHPVGRAA